MCRQQIKRICQPVKFIFFIIAILEITLTMVYVLNHSRHKIIDGLPSDLYYLNKVITYKNNFLKNDTFQFSFFNFKLYPFAWQVLEMKESKKGEVHLQLYSDIIDKDTYFLADVFIYDTNLSKKYFNDKKKFHDLCNNQREKIYKDNKLIISNWNRKKEDITFISIDSKRITLAIKPSYNGIENSDRVKKLIDSFTFNNIKNEIKQ